MKKDDLIAFIEQIGAPIFIVSKNSGKVSFINSRAEDFLAIEKENIVGVEFSKLFYLDDASRINTIVKEIGDTNIFQDEYDLKILRKSGRSLFIDMQFKLIEFNNSQYLLFIAHDITRLRKIEYELLIQSDFQESIIQSLSEMLLVLDSGGLITRGNSKVEKILGYRPEDLEKMHIRDVIKPIKNAPISWRDIYQKLRHEITINDIEANYQSKTGEDIPTLVSGSLIRYGADVINIIITAKDQRESRLVNELKTAQTRLIQQANIAAIGEMAAGVAHEINNPLVIIDGYSRKLEKSVENNNYDPSTFLKVTRKIQKAVVRITKIVSGLTQFSRDGSNLEFKENDLQHIVKDTLDFCAEKIRKRQVELKIKKSNEEIILFCNSIQVSQIFLNVINNAIDAIYSNTSITHKWINIEYYKEKGFAVILISDAGKGIPEKIAEKIFNPFFSTKGVGQGTGLGLSITKGLVDSHNGEIEVGTNADGNTLFTIRLPIAGKDGQ